MNPEVTSHPYDTALRGGHLPAGRILVADDEESMRHWLQKGLRRLGYEVEAAADGNEALARHAQGPFDAVVLDVRMPGTDGLGVLARIRALDASVPVLMISAQGTIATAVEAMRVGASDFLTKPFDLDELAARIARAREHRRVLRENQNLRSALADGLAAAGVVGSSPAMATLRAELELLRNATATVLLVGESGTGKSLVAKALHLLSERAGGPFVTLHCPAVPDTLVESELFGHEAGAFTGARTARQGLIARAHGGTLFLDEIADMSLPAQAKIERFLQEREFLPLGAAQPVRVDVRIVAASNRDLAAAAAAGTFRRELLFRLEVVQLRVPALRERREDVPLLAAHVLGRLAERSGVGKKTLTPEALAALTAHDWPGNVRELENVLERMVVLSGARDVLGVGDLPANLREPQGAPAATDYELARRCFDRGYFTALLQRAGGNVTAAARLAGLSRGHLHRRLKELQIEVRQGDEEQPAA